MAFWPLILGAAAWILVLTGRHGADFARYEAWSSALTSGDIFSLSGTIASPLGVPLSVHSPGPGMILSVGNAWFGWLHLETRADFVMMGLCVACTWWALLHLLLRFTSGNAPIAAFVLGLGFLATHLGYYSKAYSSEAASLFALSLVYYFALVPEQIAWFDALLIGVSAGFSIVVRAQLAMYAALPILIAGYRVHARLGLSKRALVCALLAGVPVLVLIVETGYVNRWMTGSSLRTPYQFGDQQFQSVDWRRPEFWAVLAHPRHGLLVYHPFYLVGFSCLVFLAVTADNWLERAVECIAISIVLMHLYLQAAWFCWWLGTGTFGMRGMAPITILLLPATAVVLDRRWRSGRAIWPLVAVSVASAVWSLDLYFQEHSNFNYWSELWSSQVVTLASPFHYLPMVVAAFVGIVFWIARRKLDPSAGIVALAGALVAVALSAVANDWAERLFNEQASSMREKLCWWGGSFALVTLGGAVALSLKPHAGHALRRSELAVGVFVVALVCAASWKFQRLARNTEAFVRARPALVRKFPVTSTVLWGEIEASYAEYQLIPGFTQEKKRFFEYLQRHRDERRGGPGTRERRRPLRKH
jgi:hypothetical protein